MKDLDKTSGFTGLETSYGIHGSNGELGCIRYCLGCSLPTSDGCAAWSKEKLIAMDEINQTLSYEIVDSNIGFNSYVSVIRISPAATDHGCMIEWSFVVDPVNGWKVEDLVTKYQLGLESMANKMEEAVISI
ncbi:lachrymatory-factor synthase-like [Heracleum sosnowskyi]|uniref:Lachrymatory-factor synthase-like n=1 Tax=Heracleum sosnowskyi TaxID=360622 RepID=A0AAD8HYR6_9APIA|nr:lachrymatory-factor synthase-like [Heracleum sosnowskyi]